MLEKFNLYDLVANLIPGALFFWSLELLARLAGCTLPSPFKDSSGWDLKEASMLLVLCYVAGLLWQSLSVLLVEKFLIKRWGGSFPSALWLMPDHHRLSPAVKERIRDLAKERFKISLEPESADKGKGHTERGMQLKKNQEIFYLCFSHVFNQSPRPQVFNSQYCQFRCLTAIFGFFTVLAAVVAVVHPDSGDCPDCTVGAGGSIWLFAGIYALATWLFYRSCRNYGESFVSSVYDLFVAGSAAKPEKD